MSYPEDLSREQLQQRQLSRLQAQISKVAASNRFWQNRLRDAGLVNGTIANLAELARLPTLRKSELVSDQAEYPPYGSNLTQTIEAYTRLHQTSGTTSGRPLRWLDTPENWSGLLNCWDQIYRIIRLRPEQRCCFPFSFGPFLGFWAGFEAAVRAGRFAVAAGGMSSEARLQLIADNHITLIGCTPTYALRLGEVAAQQGIRLRELGVETILVAGEPGGNISGVRAGIKALWGARVVDHWGMTEIGPLGIATPETPHHLTILETECIAEILHPDRDEPVTAGDMGELVITTLARIDSPVFRFRTGDLVREATDSDTSGRALLRLDGGILGRTDDMLIIRGNNVFPTSVEAIIRESAEVVEFRLIVERQRQMQELQIQLEVSPHLSSEDAAAVARRISGLIKDRLNFQARIQLVPANSLPRFEMKAQRIVKS